MINTIKDFIIYIEQEPEDAVWAIFEEECTPSLRERIYNLATPESKEPFRSAMINLGYKDY